MQKKVEIFVIVAACALVAPLLRPHPASSSPTPSPQEQAQPQSQSPSPSPSQAFVLNPSQSETVERKGGTAFYLKARIEYPQSAGAAYLLDVTADGKPMGKLLNKGVYFDYADGRRFDYCNSAGVWNVFYSPNFISKETVTDNYQVVGPEGQAYRYGWILPSGKDGALVKVQLRHVGMHKDKMVKSKLVIELE